MADKFENLDAITQRFLRELADCMDVNVTTIVASASTPKAASISIVDYKDGKATDQNKHDTVVSNGYKVGVIIKNKDSYFKIRNVTTTGNMKVQEILKIGHMGKESVVKYEDVTTYIIDTKVEFEQYEWPHNSPVNSKSITKPKRYANRACYGLEPLICKDCRPKQLIGTSSRRKKDPTDSRRTQIPFWRGFVERELYTATDVGTLTKR